MGAIGFGNPYTDRRLQNLYFNAPAPPQALKAPKRTLGQFVADKVSGAVSPIAGKRMARKLADLVDYTPVGNVTQGFDSGAQIAQGNILGGGLGALLSVLPAPRVEKALGNSILGSVAREYPMAPRDLWYSDADYAQRGGQIVQMSPDDFLSRVRPLDIDETSRDNIDDLKNHILSGRQLDPLMIGSGKSGHDGRHRAYAAKELGINQVPVIIFKP